MKSTVTILFLIILSLILFPGNISADSLHPSTVRMCSKAGVTTTTPVQKSEFKVDGLKRPGEPNGTDFINHGYLINTLYNFLPRSRIDTRGFFDAVFENVFTFSAGYNRLNSCLFASQVTVVEHSFKLIYPHHSFW